MILSIIVMSNSKTYTTCGVTGDLWLTRKQNLSLSSSLVLLLLKNICGYNPNPERVHASVSREKKRRPTSNAPDNESKESLEVVVQRVSELLDKEESCTELVLETFIKM